jgi:hypothetical protein
MRIVQYESGGAVGCGVEQDGHVYASGYLDTLSLIRDGERERALPSARLAAVEPAAHLTNVLVVDELRALHPDAVTSVRGDEARLSTAPCAQRHLRAGIAERCHRPFDVVDTETDVV